MRKEDEMKIRREKGRKMRKDKGTSEDEKGRR
jgi:hypothetical protein